MFVDSRQAAELAAATGASDLTALNLAISVVAGGMRSAGSYAFGLAWIGWAVVGARMGLLPRLLSTVGIVAGLGFALTNWIDPYPYLRNKAMISPTDARASMSRGTGPP